MMKLLIVPLLISFSLLFQTSSCSIFKEVKVNRTDQSFTLVDNSVKDPQILVSVIINNNAYSLPTFLKTLETLRCPNNKQKCDLWIAFHGCTDKSYDIFTHWLSNTREMFDSILMLNTDNDNETKEKHPELDQLYFSENLKLRALKYGLDKNFSYVFFMLADTIIIEPDVIPILLNRHHDIVAPMLTAPQTHLHDKKYSTFTAFEITSDLLDKYTYPDLEVKSKKLKSNYEKYSESKFKGSLLVKGVRDCFLFKLDQTILEKLFEMDKQMQKIIDDDDAICEQLREERVPMHMYNAGKELGYVRDKEISDRKDSFAVLRMEHLLNGPDGTFNEPLPVTEFVEQSLRKTRKTKLGFNEIYVINLKRRPDRKNRSEAALDELNISHKFVEAVDGRTMNEDMLEDLGINLLPSYRDPHSGRFMNYGEIGCFLSHYNIWKEAVEKNYDRIIILEDDARFEMSFKSTLKHVINQISEKSIEWDLIYLGRKIMRTNEEAWNYDVDFKKGFGLRKVSFSHWTIAYALSLSGAKKLLESKPLLNMIPIDEYLPLMYNTPSNTSWNSFYPNRNLIAYAIQPSIIWPTHFTGNKGYVTDTEHTVVLDPTKFVQTLDKPQGPEIKKEIADKFAHMTEL